VQAQILLLLESPDSAGWYATRRLRFLAGDSRKLSVVAEAGIAPDGHQLGPNSHQPESNSHQVAPDSHQSLATVTTGIAARLPAPGTKPRRQVLRRPILDLCTLRPFRAQELAAIHGARWRLSP
jgi:hypothetical protein